MSQLWMNAPYGYPYAERLEKNDVEGIRRFLIMIAQGDRDTEDIIRVATHEQMLKMLEESGFTFDETWLGNRPLPERPDGVVMSALDDPRYRMEKGIGNSL